MPFYMQCCDIYEHAETLTNYTLVGKLKPPMDAVVEEIKHALAQDQSRTEPHQKQPKCFVFSPSNLFCHVCVFLIFFMLL